MATPVRKANNKDFLSEEKHECLISNFTDTFSTEFLFYIRESLNNAKNIRSDIEFFKRSFIPTTSDALSKMHELLYMSYELEMQVSRNIEHLKKQIRVFCKRFFRIVRKEVQIPHIVKETSTQITVKDPKVKVLPVNLFVDLLDKLTGNQDKEVTNRITFEIQQYSYDLFSKILSDDIPPTTNLFFQDCLYPDVYISPESQDSKRLKVRTLQDREIVLRHQFKWAFQENVSVAITNIVLILGEMYACVSLLKETRQLLNSKNK